MLGALPIYQIFQWMHWRLLVKVGDLIKWHKDIGIVTRVFEHKCWRTGELGKKVDFSQIDSELFAEVLLGGDIRRIPACDLEVVGE
jgi:hypothetical protein